MPRDLSESPVGSTVLIKGTDARFNAPYEVGAFVPAPLPLGLLEPYSDAKYDRLFWNRRVFEAIEG